MTIATIETGIQIPERKPKVVTSFGNPISLSETIDKLPDDGSFIVDVEWMRKHALIRGKQTGVTLTSQKQDGRYRIWKLKK